ncbi:CD9 antigen-like [Acipenser oxyrinchus oxyrinchus]|uniref:Tetraspanin n=1 Tax=Acipenser oxyrinchus oxyrinchus TaxID=40147 RepID=A0AAD8CJL2_ACIOX|nr:CD9 antigen-like [Acipenser oxyrinchus oxyrinchus]
MGKVKGGMKCVKYLLFIFNFIFWVVGSVVLAVGLWLRFDSTTTSIFAVESSPATFFIGVYILIGAGTLIMLVGFFGCCGAVRESQCLLGLFFSSILVIFAAEVAAGVFGFMNKDTIVNEIKDVYTSAVDDFNRDYSSNHTLTVFHEALKCCGNGTPDKDINIHRLCTKGDEKSCLLAIEEFFNGKLYIIGYVGIGIAGVMIIGMVFSMVLCCAIRNSRDMI